MLRLIHRGTCQNHLEQYGSIRVVVRPCWSTLSIYGRLWVRPGAHSELRLSLVLFTRRESACRSNFDVVSSSCAIEDSTRREIGGSTWSRNCRLRSGEEHS